MKRSISLFKIFGMLLMIGGLMFTACKKEEIPGPKGDPGEPGGGGNSNISSTSIFTVGSSLWVADTLGDCLRVTLNFTELTNDVVTKGAVKVYIQTGSTWTELPYVTGDLFTQFGFSPGVLHLNYINIEGGLPGPPPTANYRMVTLFESE